MPKPLTKVLVMLHLKHRGSQKIEKTLGQIDSLVDQLNAAVKDIEDEQQHHADETEALKKRNQDEIARLMKESTDAQANFSAKINDLDAKKNRAIRAATRIAQLTA